MLRKKENIVIIVALALMLIAIIGVSFAAFSFSGTGKTTNTITTGSITMSYTESDNVINIKGALPTTDKTGKVRLTEGEYFDFTVSSEITGNVNINYEISAKDVTSSDAKKIDGKYIKLYLTRLTDDGEEELMAPETYNEETSTNDYTGRPSGEMSLYTSSMNSSESNNYRLRMYVDESYNPQGDGGGLTFTVKINVYGKDGLSMEDRMMRVAGSEDFHSSEYRSKITSIVTKGDTIIPEGVVESWDISEKQNGSVIAYAEDDGTGAGTYKLTIGGEGSIIANYDMSRYFAGFTNCISMNLDYLDTSITENMFMLFLSCFSLENLNLSAFNTSEVTNMKQMFSNTFSLKKLDLSNFNTVNVTDMSYMFAPYGLPDSSGLSEIIFGDNFNTSNVTNMSGMFSGCNSLKKLDLSGFDTSNVTNMSYMFSSNTLSTTPMDLEKIIFGSKFNTSRVELMIDMFFNCCKLTELDLSMFNTSNVTAMRRMFAGCLSLAKLDLRSFVTSKVTNMSGMFENCYSLTELDLTSFDTSSVTNYSDMFQNRNQSSLSSILVTAGKWTIPNTVITNAVATDFTYI